MRIAATAIACVAVNHYTAMELPARPRGEGCNVGGGEVGVAI